MLVTSFVSCLLATPSLGSSKYGSHADGLLCFLASLAALIAKSIEVIDRIICHGGEESCPYLVHPTLASTMETWTQPLPRVNELHDRGRETRHFMVSILS